jgi:hypothetical protein
VISIRRSSSLGARLRSVASRRPALAVGSALVLSLAVAVAPADAIVTTVPSTTTTVGLQPRSTSLFVGSGTEPEHFANGSGAPVLPSSKTYAIYWDPTNHYHGDWQGLIDTFFNNMGAASGSFASVFAVDGQYTDAANQHAAYQSTFMGAYTDTDPYPTSGDCTDPHPLEGESYPKKEPDAIGCLTNAEIQTELKTFIADHGLAKGMGTIFYLLTPPGVTVCLDEAGDHCSDYAGLPGETSYENSFCSYHADINPDNAPNGDSNTILYADIPWSAGGLADGHLAKVDRTSGDECQDGGFDPSSKPIEEKEHIKVRSPLEEEEFNKKSAKEKREQEEAEALELSKPHQQEPNQVPCPSPDGYCDIGLADLIVNQIAVEQQNTVTDPLLDAWKDPSGNEATDECRDFFAPIVGGSVTASPETFAGTLFNQTLAGGNYYLNDGFDLASLKLAYPGIPCLSSIRLEPKFTSPNPVKSGEMVDFDGMESYITLNWGTSYSGGTPKPAYATYKWNFGDGSPEVTGYAPGAPSANSPSASPCEAPWLTPCAASTFHSYQYGGNYNVTLTVTDTGGNTASVTNPITVEGASAPSSGGSGSGGSSGGSGSSGSSASSTSSTTGSSTATGSATPAVAPKPPVPNPVAAAATVSKSLSQVLRSGLVVRYSVNEQVAGRFEVLLASSIAKRIGLHGSLASGLPQGTAPQIVIAKAILVTTKGGRSTIKILFGKTTAARLRKLHKVSLMLRLIVRNASSQSPTSTTVISTVNLGR